MTDKDLVYPTTKFYHGHNESTSLGLQGGISKRELFAAMAMQGLLVNEYVDSTYDECAKTSVRYADALLTELEKSEKSGEVKP